jgi:hypothetical protein
LREGGIALAQLKCEYPCRLDLFAQVVKAKNIQRSEQIVYDLDSKGNKIPKLFCIAPPADLGGAANKIVCVEDIRIRNLCSTEEFICNNKVQVTLKGRLVMVLRVVVDNNDELFVRTEDLTFTKIIKLSEFVPPLSPHEFLEEVDQSAVIVKNIRVDWDIDDFCTVDGTITGTQILISVYADIIDKLGKWQDVVVYGELDPEDC